jgi:hypothetical protein
MARIVGELEAAHDRAGRWVRITPLAGVVFVALSVLASVLVFEDSPDGERFPDSEVVSWYADHHERIATGNFVFVVGALFFLVFLLVLRRRLALRGGERSGLPGAAFAAGSVFIGLLLVGNALIGGVATAYDFAKPFDVDPNTARVVGTIHFWTALSSIAPAAVMIGAASVAAGRTGLFVPWLARVGVAVAIAVAISLLAGYYGLILILAWVLLASIALAVRPGVPAAPG